MNDIEQSLYELVNGAAEPALGIAGGRIIIANGPAREKLGPVEGRSALSVLPALVLGREAGSYCASLDLGGRRVAARFSRLGDATLCRLSFSRPRTEMSRRAGLEHALRASLADLRLAVDRVCGLSAGRARPTASSPARRGLAQPRLFPHGADSGQRRHAGGRLQRQRSLRAAGAGHV